MSINVLHNRRILLVAFVMAFMSPMVVKGGDTGKDWYCSEPEAHSQQYQKHVRLHIDHGAVFITEKLEKIFTDSTLTVEQKKTKTVGILNKYLSRAKAGMGD